MERGPNSNLYRDITDNVLQNLGLWINNPDTDNEEYVELYDFDNEYLVPGTIEFLGMRHYLHSLEDEGLTLGKRPTYLMDPANQLSEREKVQVARTMNPLVLDLAARVAAYSRTENSSGIDSARALLNYGGGFIPGTRLYLFRDATEKLIDGFENSGAGSVSLVSAPIISDLGDYFRKTAKELKLNPGIGESLLYDSN